MWSGVRLPSYVTTGTWQLWSPLRHDANPSADTKLLASVMSSWIGADWGGSACDGMHDKKCFTERLARTLVGKGSHGKYKNWNKDPQHREDCRMYGIFPQVHDDAARSTGYEC